MQKNFFERFEHLTKNGGTLGNIVNTCLLLYTCNFIPMYKKKEKNILH